MDNAVILDLTNYTRCELGKKKAFIIGSGPQCDYIIKNPDVAGMQCLLAFNGENWFLSNLNKIKPTLINDDVACLEHNINSSDIITIESSTALQIIFYDNEKDIPSKTESEECHCSCSKERRKVTSIRVKTKTEAQIIPATSGSFVVKTIKNSNNDVELLEKYKSEATALRNALDAVINCVEQEFACCVCSEVIFKAVGIKCGHNFCQFCLNRWLLSPNNVKIKECPMCRKRLSETIPILNIDSFIEKASPYLGSSFVLRRKEIENERAADDLTVKPGPSSSLGKKTSRGSRESKKKSGAAGDGL